MTETLVKQKIRPIAIYLPQYHPIPENDEWWGKGFTEWTNVTKTQPLFQGHYQPHLPSDLGFYDLRLPEAREAQAQLAKEHGIFGFCYYHYWFSGKRILERPFNEVYKSKKPDFPFMLCWANENWSRKWDGRTEDILLQQEYSSDDDKNHINSLMPYFKDERYIKIDGKPVFIVYKSSLLPNVEETIKIWREEAFKEGIELYLCRFESFGEYGKSFIEQGFDAGIDFQPFSEGLQTYIEKIHAKAELVNSNNKVKKKAINFLKKISAINNVKSSIDSKVRMDYNDFVDHIMKTLDCNKDYPFFPGAFPSWDNTARRGENAFYFINANPSKFKEWLSFLSNVYKPHSKNENFLFINAWNEWAEGCHLEPCQKWHKAYLDAVREVLKSSNI